MQENKQTTTQAEEQLTQNLKDLENAKTPEELKKAARGVNATHDIVTQSVTPKKPA